MPWHLLSHYTAKKKNHAKNIAMTSLVIIAQSTKKYNTVMITPFCFDVPGNALIPEDELTTLPPQNEQGLVRRGPVSNSKTVL